MCSVFDVLVLEHKPCEFGWVQERLEFDVPVLEHKVLRVFFGVKSAMLLMFCCWSTRHEEFW